MTTFRIIAAPLRLPDGERAEYGEETWVVTDDTGVAWPCLTDPGVTCTPALWAGDGYRQTEGHVVATAEGDLAVATCLGDPIASSFEGIPSAAGVVYGVNGVGHQIANRLLFDTGVDVRDAQGAWFSWWLFGTYGTSIPAAKLLGPALGPVGKALEAAVDAGAWLDWERRKQRCHTTRTMIDDARDFPGQLQHLASQLEQGTDAAAAAFGGRAQEIAATVEARLAGAAAPRAIDDLRAFIESAADDLSDLAPALDVATDPAGVAADCNATFSRYFAEVARLLGSDAYVELFGAPPGAPVTLIDPAVFARV